MAASLTKSTLNNRFACSGGPKAPEKPFNFANLHNRKFQISFFMKITINVTDGKLVTHHGKQPFKLPNLCPICGHTMRLKEVNNGTTNEDPYYFEITCSLCRTSIITEADEAGQE